MMLSCKAASRLVSQSLDRPLTWQERLALRFHLAICKNCKRFSQQLAKLAQAVQVLVKQAEADESVKLSLDAKTRIANQLNKL